MLKKFLLFSAVMAAVGTLGWLILGKQLSGGSSQNQMPYNLYTGNRPALNVTFTYPQSWSAKEEEGKIEFYSGVRFLGPRNAEDTFTAYISVRGFPLKAFGGAHERLQALAKHHSKHAPAGSKTLLTQSRKIGGIQGSETLLAFTRPAFHHKGLKPLPVPVKQQRVLVEKSPYLYELTYSADAREFDRFSQAFNHLIDTFRFQ